MRKVFKWQFEVRSYEVGRYGVVDNANFINYLEEAALRGSAFSGYDSAWFEANDCLWVIRTWMIRYYAPTYYGDQLEAHTWVSDFKRVQSHREYEILRDGKRIVRARANWVFIDANTLRPKRVLSEFEEAYRPSGEVLEDLELRLDEADAADTGREFVYQRTAQYYELDKVGHVNNAQYIRWIEEASVRAMRSITGGEDHGFQVMTHELDYKQSAQADDPIAIKSQVVGVATDKIALTHAIRHAENDTLIAEDYSIVRVDGARDWVATRHEG